MLEKIDRIRLLEVARHSVLAGIDRDLPAPAPEHASASACLWEPCATFTTLELDGELRGCCGTIEPRRPLLHDVWYNAWASAYSDSRFPRVCLEELAALRFTISVLSPLERVPVHSESELIAALRPGVDGLVLACGFARATFLPQVWQSLPEPREFLAHLWRKAGFSPTLPWSEVTALRYRTDTFSSAEDPALAA